MIRVLIVEEHDLVREALEARLRQTTDLQVVRSTGNYSHAAQQAQTLRPDVILMEIKAAHGLETLNALHEAAPTSAILVLTSSPDSREEAQALARGARRYLLKTLHIQGLIEEIRLAAQIAVDA